MQKKSPQETKHKNFLPLISSIGCMYFFIDFMNKKSVLFKKKTNLGKKHKISDFNGQYK